MALIKWACEVAIGEQADVILENERVEAEPEEAPLFWFSFGLHCLKEMFLAIGIRY